MNSYEITWERTDDGDWIYRREYMEDYHAVCEYAIEFTKSYPLGEIRLHHIALLEKDALMSTDVSVLTRERAIEVIQKYNSTLGASELDLTPGEGRYIEDLVMMYARSLSAYEMVNKIARGTIPQ